MAISFYLDAHISPKVARELRHRGIDVLAARDVDMLDSSDAEHLALAHRQGRVMCTQDKDYLILNALGTPHSGIAFAKQGTPIGQMVNWLSLIHQVYDAQDMVGRVERL